MIALNRHFKSSFALLIIKIECIETRPRKIKFIIMIQSLDPDDGHQLDALLAHPAQR